MKAIIERALSLSVRYTLTDKKYIPLENGCGLGCDNCGKLIANIATVRSESGQSYNIGFDCLETLLINNSLLSSGDVEQYEKVKKMIPKVLRFAKTIKEVKSGHNVTGLLFEAQKYPSEYFTFYWLTNGQTTSRDNDYVKLKEMDFNFLIETLRNIFPHMQILVKN